MSIIRYESVLIDNSFLDFVLVKVYGIDIICRVGSICNNRRKT